MHAKLEKEEVYRARGAVMKPIYVLGTGLSHDGSACLLKDGRIRFAIEKERVTRRKHDGGNDAASIQYLLDAEGIGIGKIDLVVQNANFGMLADGNDWYQGPRPAWGSIPVITISHHLAHAYGAFATSSFDEAAVLIIDGCGNSFDDCIDLGDGTILEAPTGEIAHLWHEKDSYYDASAGRLRAVVKDFSPWGDGTRGYALHPPTTRHSIGGVYAAASKYVFRGLEDPGKLMGLAPYGRPGAFSHEVFDLREGRVFVRYDWMERFREPARTQAQFNESFQSYADLALGIQREVERAILYLARARHEAWPMKALCYAGGVALNAVANRKLLTEGPFESIHIQPAAGDNGIAVGCAYYGWLAHLGMERPAPSRRVYFGKSYSPAAADDALERYGELVQLSRIPDAARDAAIALSRGSVVGWFQGGSEFGPRALGNRSILADPRPAHMRDYINAKIKFREDFRPFAPAALAEEGAIYFDCKYASPHMLLTAPVLPEWSKAIPAVVHRDGSARLQTVTHADNPEFHALITAFRDVTGIGMVLNTSLNKRGMPIVETPEEALLLFLYTEIDLLFIGNLKISKRPDFGERFAVFQKLLAQAGAQRVVQESMAT